MDIVGLITNLIGGAVGGNLTGMSLKDINLGTIGNTIAGAIGGTAGTFILQAMGVLSSLGLTSMSAGSLATEAGSSAIIKNKMAK